MKTIITEQQLKNIINSCVEKYLLNESLDDTHAKTTKECDTWCKDDITVPSYYHRLYNIKKIAENRVNELNNDLNNKYSRLIGHKQEILTISGIDQENTEIFPLYKQTGTEVRLRYYRGFRLHYRINPIFQTAKLPFGNMTVIGSFPIIVRPQLDEIKNAIQFILFTLTRAATSELGGFAIIKPDSEEFKEINFDNIRLEPNANGKEFLQPNEFPIEGTITLVDKETYVYDKEKTIISTDIKGAKTSRGQRKPKKFRVADGSEEVTKDSGIDWGEDEEI